MSKSNQTEELPDEIELRWAHAITLLSLDVVVPFQTSIGIEVATPLAVRDCCRVFIRERRKAFYPVNLNQQYLKASDILLIFGASLGEASAAQLDKWFETVYSEEPRDHLGLLHWDYVLRSSRRDPVQWLRLGLPDRLREVARLTCIERVNTKAYEVAWERIRTDRLSDWDLHLYAIYLWDDDDLDAPSGPEALIYPSYATAASYGFWKWLLPQLSEAEIRSMHTAGSEIISTTAGLGYIQNLPAPNSLLSHL